jgi:hypothetical protein
VKHYWEIIADRLKKADWSLGCVAAVGLSRANDLDCSRYGTETKVFGEPMLTDGTLARLGHNEGVQQDGNSGAQGSDRLAGLDGSLLA